MKRGDFKEKKKQQEVELREAFMSRQVAPEAFERINSAVRLQPKTAIGNYRSLRFRPSYCDDGGRRINIADPEWPSTLTGFAKDAFDFYVKELRPLGYKLHAEIISFPGGMPGDVALFLSW